MTEAALASCYMVYSSNHLHTEKYVHLKIVSVAVRTSLHLKMMASTTRGTSELKACVGEGREATRLKKVLLKIVQASCLRSDLYLTFILINET